jgi:hypothetical protein
MTITYESALAVDLEETVHNMVDAAVAVTTGRMNLAVPTDVRQRLVAGDSAAVAYFRYELARQIAAALLWMDARVIAVYKEQPVPEGEEVAPPEATFREPLRILVQVEYQTPALHAVLDALNEALGQVLGGLFPDPLPGHQRFIHATVIDDPDSPLLKPRAYGYRPAPTLLAP